MKKNITLILIIVGCLIIIPIIIVVTLYFMINYSIIDLTGLNELGDAVGGLTNPIIGVIGAVLTFLAFYIQYDFNKRQSAILDLQSKIMMHQNFHETFSLLLEKFEKIKSQKRYENIDWENEYTKYLTSFSYMELHSAGSSSLERLTQHFNYNKKMIEDIEEILHKLIDYTIHSEFLLRNKKDSNFINANLSKLFTLVSEKEQGIIINIIYENFFGNLPQETKQLIFKFIQEIQFNNIDLYKFLKNEFSM